MDHPLVSIIIPMYNAASTIKHCLKSVLAQTYKAIEVIVIDDGSTDDSLAICQTYAKEDGRLIVYSSDKIGVSGMRNIGIKQAGGQFIGFVDADDFVSPVMYERLVSICLETKSDVAISHLGRMIDGQMTEEVDGSWKKEMTTEEALEELFQGNLYRFSLCNKLFHRSCFKQVSFPEGRIHEDLARTYLLLAQAGKITYLHETHYIYVRQQNSILTRRYDKRRLDAFIGWDEILSYMNKHFPSLRDVVHECFTYNCLDHFYVIIHDVKDKKERDAYVRRIQQMIRIHGALGQANKRLSFKTRLMMRMLYYHSFPLIAYSRLKKLNNQGAMRYVSAKSTKKSCE